MRDSEGNAKGSLLTYLDRCVNPMGHRHLKRWLSTPLGEIGAINERLNAVQFLRDNQSLRDDCQRVLKSLPDLERLISSLHAYSIKKEKTEVMYGQQEQRKLSQFVQVLDGLVRALDIPIRIASQHGLSRQAFQSQELALCTVQFPRYDEVVAEFQSYAEDWAKAKADGYVTPTRGKIAAYDKACDDEAEAQARLAEYLEAQREELKCREVKFLHVNRDRFTLEIPARIKPGHDYLVVSGTAKAKRYYTRELKEELLPLLEDAELNKERIEKDSTRLIYGKFTSYQVAWKRAIEAVATLDCLCSLASVSAEQMADGLTCRPDFVPFDEARGPLLELKGCIHPVLAKHMPAGKGKTFIPNDIALGCGGCPAPIVLLSGANMGGHSTLCLAFLLTRSVRDLPSPRFCLCVPRQVYAAAPGVHCGDPRAVGLLRARYGGSSHPRRSHLHPLRSRRPPHGRTVHGPPSLRHPSLYTPHSAVPPTHWLTCPSPSSLLLCVPSVLGGDE